MTSVRERAEGEGSGSVDAASELMMASGAEPGLAGGSAERGLDRTGGGGTEPCSGSPSPAAAVGELLRGSLLRSRFKGGGGVERVGGAAGDLSPRLAGGGRRGSAPRREPLVRPTGGGGGVERTGGGGTERFALASLGSRSDAGALGSRSDAGAKASSAEADGASEPPAGDGGISVAPGGRLSSPAPGQYLPRSPALPEPAIKVVAPRWAPVARAGVSTGNDPANIVRWPSARGGDAISDCGSAVPLESLFDSALMVRHYRRAFLKTARDHAQKSQHDAA